MTHFGEWLFDARKKARLSQEELADKAGVSKNYISVIERNLPNYKTGALPQPSRKVVVSLAVALGTSERETLEAAGYSPELQRTDTENTPENEGKDFPEWMGYGGRKAAMLPPKAQEELKRKLRQETEFYTELFFERMAEYDEKEKP